MADRSALPKVLRILGVNIRQFRVAAGLTQESAAERADIEPRHWQKLEAGEVNVTVNTLVAVAGALDVEIAALFLAPCSGRDQS